MRKKVFLIVLILLGSMVLSGCTKNDILRHYNDVIAIMGESQLTDKRSLEGEKKAGADDYTGSYRVSYENASKTEYLFGGTSINREMGREVAVTCTLKVSQGHARVFWISGAEESVGLIETNGTYSGVLTLPDGGNYIGVECENFTGSIELEIA